MKNKLILVIAVLVGILAFWLSARYLKSERNKLYGKYGTIEVLVASRSLTAMTIISSDDLRKTKVLKTYVGNNAFLANQSSQIIGKRLKTSMERGNIFSWRDIDMQHEIRTGLSAIVNKRNRAVSISIAGAAAVSGLVKPNDHVDILGTFTFPSRTNPQQIESVTLTLMQNVTVLATGRKLARKMSENGLENEQDGYSTVTFEVTPREAEILVFAQQTRGQLYLSLRSPDDIYSEEELPSVNFDYLESVLKDLNTRRQIRIQSKVE
jgi:pilus assembly protein CpaB